MQRCIELALNGAGYVTPNPLVGAVLVHEGRIIGEGWHRQYGEPHAEVNAINSVKEEDRHLIAKSILYVNLEPCSHHGKTPPCTDLVIKHKIPHVVVANVDPNPIVAGSGIDRLVSAGVKVELGIMEAEGAELNCRFLTNHRLQRPYVVIKWAQSADGYFTRDRGSQHWITGPTARKLAHRWRSEEDAVMVGTGTALADNPRLDVRFWPGAKQPIRVVIDRHNAIPFDNHLMDRSIPTIVFSNTPLEDEHHLNYVHMQKGEMPDKVLNQLYSLGIRSVLVEGGANVIESFIAAGLWDEARVFVGQPYFGGGVKAPALQIPPFAEHQVGDDRLYLFKRIP